MMDYWKRTVGHIEVYRYHLEKPGHSLLIGALLSLVFPSLLAVTIAVFSYLLIGKALVKSSPSLDWIADLLIGSLAIVAERAFVGDGWTLLYLWVWVVLYAWVVLTKRWASP